MTSRVGIWVLAVVIAGLVIVLHISRYSWQYGALTTGAVVVAAVISRFGISFRRQSDGSESEPAGDLTHEHSLGPLSVGIERESDSADARVDEVFQRAPGGEADPAKGDR